MNLEKPDEASFTTDSQETWHRVHPVSPLVRGWVAVVAVVYIFGRNAFDSLLAGGWDDGGSLDGNSVTGGTPLPVVIAIIAGAVVIFGVAFFLSWKFTRYQVTDTSVHINSGVVFRQQRQARIDRVQAIDVVQPLVARAFGLAELKFEVADGGKSAMRLAFLKLGEAKRLRAAILARAAGVEIDPAAPSAVQEAPETPVLSLPAGRIIGAAFLSGTTVTAVVVGVGVSVAVGMSGEPAIWLGAVPLLLAFGAGYWKAITTDFNFRLATSADGIRLHYGMLETRSQTIPPGRVQAVGVTQGPIWRLVGWYRVHVNVAGYGADTTQSGTRSVILPAGTIDEVMSVLGLIFPQPGVDNPFEVFTAGVRGSGTGHGFVSSPRQARWLDPLAWRRNAYRATDTALLCRRGAVVRLLEVVPHERTQSLGLQQGPLMAALGLASFVLHSTPGPVRPLVKHMSLANALALFDEQAQRAATARRIHRQERWLEVPQPQLHSEEVNRGD